MGPVVCHSRTNVDVNAPLALVSSSQKAKSELMHESCDTYTYCNSSKSYQHARRTGSRILCNAQEGKGLRGKGHRQLRCISSCLESHAAEPSCKGPWVSHFESADSDCALCDSEGRPALTQRSLCSRQPSCEASKGHYHSNSSKQANSQAQY